MDFQIIQLSDIHFKVSNNSILDKQEKLLNAIRNEIRGQTLIMVTGDSAFSGQEAEFKIAETFFDNIAKELSGYSGFQVDIMIIPGNHDVQALKSNNPVRDLVLDTIQQHGNFDEGLIEEVVKNQENYFKFENKYNSKFDSLYESKILKIYQINVNGKTLHFNCYNTAFQSVLHETPGKMVMPSDLNSNVVCNSPADLKFSCFHHPLNWLSPESLRIFRNHITNTSDFFLTGHEHVESKSMITNLDGVVVYHLEGDVLQDSDDSRVSGFNLLHIDSECTRFKVENYRWRGDAYIRQGHEEWKPLLRGSSTIIDPFSLSTMMKDRLRDAGATFSHPNIAKIDLADIYVYPNLEQINLRDDQGDEATSTIINSKDYFESLKGQIRIIFSGSENIGKTSLLKMLYARLHHVDYIPILLNGGQVRSTNIEDIRKYLSSCFIEQYHSNDQADFEQLLNSRVVIFLDDFNRVKLNARYKARLLLNLINNFANIVISGNELMSLEDIIMDEASDNNLYSTFSMFEIKEFGFQLRSKLINKWNTLGLESTITEEERIRKLQSSESVVNTVIGVNFVPAYPFFLLTILQSIEVGNPTDLSASTFGHYYQFLIQKSFTRIISTQREITEYQNYLSELAFYLFTNSIKAFDRHEFEEFDSLYRKSYTITHSAERIRENLILASILEDLGDSLEFKYSYVFYFFVSSYIASHISEEPTREIVSQLIDQLYLSEYSNILMFLTHHTKESFLLKELITKAKAIFSDLAPCRLDEVIRALSSPQETLIDVEYEERSIDEYREEENILRDSAEYPVQLIEEEVEENSDGDVGVIAQLNTAFKAIEIIGQILKNNYGKIENAQIQSLIEETMLLGLRSLNVFFQIIEESSEYIVNQVNSIVNEIEKARGRKLDNPDKIKQITKSTLFKLCSQVSYGFIKKISDSIGTEYLHDILEKVYSQHEYASMRLIKLAIKLDHYRSFPDADLKRIKSQIESNVLAYQIMKRIVVNHLYLFPTDHTQKSKILSLLGISVKTQLLIDQKSKQKKLG